MRLTKTLLFLLAFYLPYQVSAQGEADWWYFPTFTGMNFPQGQAPVPQTNGQVFYPTNPVGAATISDSCGNLLFYSDGRDVWNASHTVMPNGAIAATFCVQPIIIPNPGNKDQYYLFHSKPGFPGVYSPLAYVTVDMTLDAGNGDVAGPSTLLIDSVMCMKASVIHANLTDHWLLTHSTNTNTFYAYLINAGGIQPPVVTQIGVPLNFPTSVENSTLKFSPDGTKLAYTSRTNQTFELFDFDPATGIVSNAKTIYNAGITPADSVINAVEFSPDGSLMYWSPVEIQNVPIYPRLYQCDPNLPSGAAIMASSQLVGSIPLAGEEFWALQLGPDGKIYVADGGVNVDVHVINDPGQPGLASNFQASAFTIGTFPPQVVESQFTYFAAHYFRQSILETTTGNNPTPTQNMCLPDSAAFEVSGMIKLDSVVWDFGEPGLPTLTTSDSLVKHLYSQTGVFPVEALVYRGCPTRPDTLRDTLSVFIQPQVDLGADTSLCIGDSLRVGVNSFGSSYLWSDGTTIDSFTIKQPSIVWVEVSNLCDTLRDSIAVQYVTAYQPDLGLDQRLCEGDTLNFSFPPNQATYIWEDNSNLPTRQLFGPGTFWVEASNACGVRRDSLILDYLALPRVFLPQDTVLCSGDSLQVFVTSPEATYLWNTGDTDSTLTINTSGDFYVDATNACGTDRDSIVVAVDTPPTVDLGPDTAFCQTIRYTLDASFPGASYLWQDNSTAATYQPNAGGIYYVTVSTLCGIAQDSVSIVLDKIPIVDLGPDTTICDQGSLLLDPGLSTTASFLWQDGSTDPTLLADSAGYFTLTVTQGTCEASDDIVIGFKDSPFVDLGPDTTVCQSKELILDATQPNVSYVWQDGSTEPTFRVLQAGTYSVTVSNECGSTEDVVSFETINCQCPGSVPTGFSPNADGFNDTWLPVFGCNINSYQVQIFNRLGQSVFLSTSPTESWDGSMMGGAQLPEGVYVWVLRYTFQGTGEEVEVVKGGTVTLLR
ncbi:MAG: gliding motility-associated C-terminal domain-containing protein [Bacteroidota bacterium]